MKKLVALILAAVALLTVGFLAGSHAVLVAPKWVEEDGGMYLVVTDFGGHEYVDLAEKPSHMYEELKFAYVLGRK